MDEVLHRERLGPRPEVELDGLLDGCMVEWYGQAYLVQGGSLVPWSHVGYAGRIEQPRGAMVKLLTPSSIVETLRAGYVAKWGPGSPTLPKF
jgi:hypothetical protein